MLGCKPIRYRMHEGRKLGTASTIVGKELKLQYEIFGVLPSMMPINATAPIPCAEHAAARFENRRVALTTFTKLSHILL